MAAIARAIMLTRHVANVRQPAAMRNFSLGLNPVVRSLNYIKSNGGP